ncbi:shikimate dehydrogenase family protein [Paracoccus aerodenitrificans]|uniref:shikimate dehydrogenase family protein n=1 Tax=Paracoccus aerodenitrificans TaxID=3017781 RepID=UPI0022F02E9B|nr:shikimate dehydrogenase [Paracoccus aerodenitrificans]WBU63779.1 shikimate dehydrogenase [Paracoccus aerodenitrificans]
MISGHTKLLGHIGVPTESFKAPMIYNPWFEAREIDAVVVPMGCEPEDFPDFIRLLSRLRNFAGALITMPHKVSMAGLLDEASTAVRICGSCNALRRDADGRLIGDMFDGEGFVRGMQRKGRRAEGASALVVGSGGVGSAIAASLAGAGATSLGIYDINEASADGLAGRLRDAYPSLSVTTGSNDPAGYDIVVNATPLGMNPGDPMPLQVGRLNPSSFVGEVVMKSEETAFLAAASARGCQTQIGTDMLFEQIPAYLEFFGFPATTADELRGLAKISY